MFTVVLLLAADKADVVRWDELPLVRTWQGAEVSLRAGPRERTSHGETMEPVAVYAPDELTEEEFQELYFAHKDRIPELHLHD